MSVFMPSDVFIWPRSSADLRFSILSPGYSCSELDWDELEVVDVLVAIESHLNI